VKRYIIHIKFLLLILVIGFLFGFAVKRNTNKKIKGIDVVFTNGENLFITYEAVNKLLIQNLDTAQIQSSDSLFLNNLEKKLRSNKMIRNADIYKTIDGKIGAVITQRTPVLRVVNGPESYYLDEEGEIMPLSENYSARVPIISGEISKTSDLIGLANRIKKDAFLQKQVTGIEQFHKGNTDQFNLKTRTGDQVIVLGTVHNFQEKKNKLKAFYQKALSDSILEKFDTINLKFKNQVVCSKK
jgi:cell division protein FtsQ